MLVSTSDAEGTGGADLQRKLDLLNGALDAERAEQARRQLQYVAHCESRPIFMTHCWAKSFF